MTEDSSEKNAGSKKLDATRHSLVSIDVTDEGGPKIEFKGDRTLSSGDFALIIKYMRREHRRYLGAIRAKTAKRDKAAREAQQANLMAVEAQGILEENEDV